ncbi:Uma2 family endonuclease [Streptomyces sp. NPDC093109]|uniref:Uma2 family endonuclease n=1 Tax=Streptomyces sp. NPDC093109 TaxID=3154977 RepID=UPI00344ECF56
MGAVMAAEARIEHDGQATPENWMYPPEDGWTYDQIKELELPFDWELLDGNIVVRGAAKWWHDQVRDELYYGLRRARRAPYAVNVERSTIFDEHNVPKPDIVVFDKTGLDIRTLECTPVASVALAIEVVSPGSRTQDRFRKPGMYAEAGIAYYWRVERGEDDLPVVHEFWRHHETGVYVSSPERPTHTGKLITEVPFPVEIDLHGLIEV